MFMEIYTNEIGKFIIEPKAIKDIVEIVCEQIENIKKAKKDDFAQISIDKQNNININIAIKVKQGIDLLKTCNLLQSTIKEHIYLMTSLECNNINIDIQGFILDND